MRDAQKENRMIQLQVQDKQVKSRVRVQGKVVGKEIRVIVRGEFRYCSFREVDQMGQGALCRRGQVHAAFWGPDVFLDEKAVRACQLTGGFLSGWVASARVVYSGQTEAYILGFAFACAGSGRGRLVFGVQAGRRLGGGGQSSSSGGNWLAGLRRVFRHS